MKNQNRCHWIMIVLRGCFLCWCNSRRNIVCSHGCNDWCCIFRGACMMRERIVQSVALWPLFWGFLLLLFLLFLCQIIISKETACSRDDETKIVKQQIERNDILFYWEEWGIVRKKQYFDLLELHIILVPVYEDKVYWSMWRGLTSREVCTLSYTYK